MTIKTVSQILLPTFFVVTTAIMGGSDDSTPRFKITTKRDNDKVEVKVEKEKVVFSIQSPFGISQAVVQRTENKWPDDVILRLHLKGMESLRVTNGKFTLDASVSSYNDEQRIRLWKDGKEDSPLGSQSPWWMEIRMVGGDGNPANVIPLNDGYFEMRLPKPLFEGNPESITVNWIDFFRN